MTSLLFNSQRLDANAPPGVLLETQCHRCGGTVSQFSYELCHSVEARDLQTNYAWSHMQWFNHVLCGSCNQSMGTLTGALPPPTIVHELTVVLVSDGPCS